MPLDLSCFHLSPDDSVALQNLQRADRNPIGDSTTPHFMTGTDSLPRQTLARPAPVQPIDDVLDNWVAMSRMNVPRHSVGDLDVVCPHCSARFFRSESLNCCARGCVDLPLWRPPPEPLLSLLQEDQFRLKIRGYNCALSLGSSVFDDLTSSYGPATFKMAGRSWRLLPSSVQPPASGTHKCAQIYALPVHDATERRIELTSGPRRATLRRKWLASLHQMLLEHNHLVRSFVLSNDVGLDWNISVGALEALPPHAVAANDTMVGLLLNGGELRFSCYMIVQFPAYSLRTYIYV
jgi:hypothetical protein